MRAESRHLTIVFAAMIPFAGPAAAQDVRPLVISAGVDVRHDNNVARASVARAALRGTSRGDVSVSPNVAVELNRALGRHQLALNASAGYDFYRRNSFLNRERIAAAANGTFRVAGCALALTPEFSRRQSDLGEIAIPTTGGQDAVRNVETVQGYGGSLECGDDIGLRPIAGITRRIADNSNAFRRFSDNRLTSYTAGLGYARPTFGKVQLLFGVDDVSYPNRPPINGDEDGYRTRSGGIRFEREIGVNLTGRAQVNYLTLRPRRTDAPRFEGLTYDVGLTGTFADRLRLQASLTRAAQPALQSDAAYRVERQWSLGATYSATTLLSFGGEAVFAKRRYIGERPTFGPLIGDDRRQTYRGRADYEFSPRLRLGAEVRYQTRDANDAFYSYNSLSELVSVRFVY